MCTLIVLWHLNNALACTDSTVELNKVLANADSAAVIIVEILEPFHT